MFIISVFSAFNDMKLSSDQALVALIAGASRALSDLSAIHWYEAPYSAQHIIWAYAYCSHRLVSGLPQPH